MKTIVLAMAVSICAPAAAGAQGEMSCPEVARALQDLMRQDARLRDWPQLGRYRDANEQLKTAGTSTQVVFLGDSITDAWDDPMYGGFFPGKPYVNRGIGGQTTPQMLIRLKPDVLAFTPRVMVLLAGTNDIAGNTGPMTDEDIQNNLAAIAELASAHGVKVVLASILPTSDHHYQPERGGPPQTSRRPLERINGLNKWLRDYAASHGHVYLDYYSAVVDGNGMLKAEFSEDDLHPNARAYDVMAPLAEAAIAQALK